MYVLPFPRRGRRTALALAGATAVLFAASVAGGNQSTDEVALAAELAQALPCPTPTVDVSQIGVGPIGIFSDPTPTPRPVCAAPQPQPAAPPAPNPPATAECIVDVSQIGVGPLNVFGSPGPSAPCQATDQAAPATAPQEAVDHVGPLPEPAPQEVQDNPAGEMPPPAPPATDPVPPAEPEASGPLPESVPLGEYGACFSYGLVMSFSGFWSTVTQPTTIYIAIQPDNQYTAFALGNDGVGGSFSYDPGTGEIVWLDGTFQGWPSTLNVGPDGQQVIRVKEISDQGVGTTYRCPLG